ncbi:MAG: pyridoxal phosphate-dependent aminotransferase [Acidibacillus sp.]|uniref:cysteine-S-conjugate beta-lyase n=1 Tax=Sulfoacidibacillus ferrooxidans TaxID=2005001 RepID=A0A9X1V8D5_9BACL|nr:MalY/PatB family protein [Sulfoacidibacillus ferrooxidans]MCI0182690.1 Cystathionine beta-lyase PatB [Sulfoacidibacillus ferrooxidans]MCY0893328.1 pyridoxal phosphate-dependent aminotransferase [Acidibacillus sp.]
MDFDQLYDRRHTASLKWDALLQLYGAEDLLPLWVADMDFRVPNEVLSALHERVEHGIFGYQSPREDQTQAIVDWWQKRHQFHIEPEWIVYAPGVVPSLSLAVQELTDPQDKVIIQPPVYPPFTKVVKENDRQVVHNPLHHEHGRYTIDFENLEQRLQEGAKMLILCNPHNPVGRVFDHSELTRLGDLCERYGTLVVSDEIHGDLVYTPHKHIPFASVDERFMQFSLTCAAPSKTFNIAGFHASYMVIPNETLRKTFSKALDRLALRSQNVLSSTAMLAAYRHGEPWLDELLPYLKENLTFLQEELQKRIPEISMEMPEGTYLAWLDCRKLGLDGEELKKFMIEKAKLALNDGAAFGLGGEGFMRVNVACPRTTLVQAIHQLEHAVTELHASRS